MGLSVSWRTGRAVPFVIQTAVDPEPVAAIQRLRHCRGGCLRAQLHPGLPRGVERLPNISVWLADWGYYNAAWPSLGTRDVVTGTHPNVVPWCPGRSRQARLAEREQLPAVVLYGNNGLGQLHTRLAGIHIEHGHGLSATFRCNRTEGFQLAWMAVDLPIVVDAMPRGGAAFDTDEDAADAGDSSTGTRKPN